jgi:hypothetical protein
MAATPDDPDQDARVDPDGYVTINGNRVLGRLLHSASTRGYREILAERLDLTADELEAWARDEGTPLGLPWAIPPPDDTPPTPETLT